MNRSQRKTLRSDLALSSISRNSRASMPLGSMSKRPRQSLTISDVAKEVRALAAQVNSEDKNLPTQLAFFTVAAATSVVSPFALIPQGADSNQRVGVSVRINRIDGNIVFKYSTGTNVVAANQSQVFNWYLVRYLKTPSSSGASAFAITDFLALDPNSQTTPFSLPNVDLNGNFSVMASGTQEIDLSMYASTSAVDSALSIVVPFRHNCSFHQLYQTSATSTVCDNTVFMVYTALNAANTGGTSSVAHNLRMWYVDN
jgi:hypothetical protein